MEQQMALMRTALALIAALGLGAALSGCTPFPQLNKDASEAALAQPYPDLVPLDSLQARLNTTGIAPETAPAIEARIARLKARAAGLRGTVIDSQTRARMKAGVRQ